MGASGRQRSANIYVDGFNLYHGCFDNPRERSTWRPFRWLDLDALGRRFCHGRPIGRIRYFTALTDSIPPGHSTGQARQLIYWRALRTIPHLTIHEGRFAVNVKERLCADPASPVPSPLLPHRTTPIIEREEKGSDVNLASYLLLDAFKQEYDLAIVISNDSDLAEPIRIVRREFGVKVCIVNPRKKLARDLNGVADFYRQIRFEMIRDSQFPPSMSDTVGAFTKPADWN